MAEDVDIRHHITELVSTERDLREQLAAGQISTGEEHERLRKVETELDQCWDLLRQRQALRDSGGDPSRAAARSESTGRGLPGLSVDRSRVGAKSVAVTDPPYAVRGPEPPGRCVAPIV